MPRLWYAPDRRELPECRRNRADAGVGGVTNRNIDDQHGDQGWQDRGRFSYAAETRDGPVEVPCHRYERELTLPAG